jgi:UPF0755 protein
MGTRVTTMWKHVAANGMSLLILLGIALAGAVGWGQRQWVAEGPLEQAVFFEVERGATLREVSENLAEAGAVSSAAIFRLGTEYADAAGDLRFGSYEIPAGASMETVLEIVTAGGPSSFRYAATYVLRIDGTGELRLRERLPGSGEIVELATFSYEDGVPEVYTDLVEQEQITVYRVAIPEGLTSWQIVQGLNVADFLSGEVVDIPAEGTLAPDTYEVRRGDDRNDILQRMREAQEVILAEVWAGRVEGLPIDTPEEALILASIIEKETSDSRRAAARFRAFSSTGWNQGMRLQTDPTVIYGVTEGRGVLGRGIAAERIASGRQSLEHLCHRRAAADADRQPRARCDRGGGGP